MTLALIKETIMAKELIHYAKCHGYTEEQTEELVTRAANYSLGERGEGWWISQALQDDAHMYFDMMSSFDWEATEEGDGYWREIYRFVARDPMFKPEG